MRFRIERPRILNWGRAIVLTVSLGVTSRVHAVALPSYSLVGLILRSKAVVLAERLAPVGEKTRFRVKKTYRGSMLSGEEIAIDLSGYELRLDGDFETPKALDPESVLFLEDLKKVSLVPSGIKVLSGGRVYGFMQMRNPGPYSLRAQSPHKEDDDLDAWLSDLSPMTLPMLEGELRMEIARVEAFNSVLETKDAKVKAKKLFELLGPACPPPVLLRDYDLLWIDDLEMRIVKAMEETAGRRLALMGLANRRAPPRAPSGQYPDTVDSTKFLPDALDRDLADELREAATQTLHASLWKPKEATLSDALRSLIHDPSRRIRRAAIVKLAERLKRPGEEQTKNLDAILTAGRTETEPSIRLLLLEVATRLQLGDLQREIAGSMTFPLLACYEGGRVYAAWAFPQEARVAEAEIIAVAARRVDAKERRTAPVKSPRTSEYNFFSSLRVAFTPPLEPGDYELRVEGQFRLDGKPAITAVSPTIAVSVPRTTAPPSASTTPKKRP